MASKRSKTGIVLIAVFIALVVAIVVGLVSAPNEGGVDKNVTPTQSSEPTEKPEPQPEEPVTSGTETGTGYTVEEITAILSDLSISSGTVDNSGYDRDLFGNGWLDPDGNGCDSRNDILLRDLTEIVMDSDGCRILSGVLDDTYTGESINFVRGQSTSLAVQIDHMVPLSRAWALGASSWDSSTLKAFANDPANLFASKGSANGSKSDQGLESWTPAIYSCTSSAQDGGLSSSAAKQLCLNDSELYSGKYYTAFECEYASRYALVSDKYELMITQGDFDRAIKSLELCV